VRILAFALNASDRLTPTRGLCVEDEPDLWTHSLSGEIDLWVEVGLPEERRMRKACARAARVRVYAYGGRQAALWWARTGPGLQRVSNLAVTALPEPATRALPALVARNMRLQCTVQDGQVWLGDEQRSVLVELESWRDAAS
jgi:uncharacterized protein YaeQ